MSCGRCFATLNMTGGCTNDWRKARRPVTLNEMKGLLKDMLLWETLLHYYISMSCGRCFAALNMTGPHALGSLPCGGGLGRGRRVRERLRRVSRRTCSFRRPFYIIYACPAGDIFYSPDVEKWPRALAITRTFSKFARHGKPARPAPRALLMYLNYKF